MIINIELLETVEIEAAEVTVEEIAYDDVIH